MSQIIKKDVIEVLPEYYLPYAQYVNQTRALPDARDGLKQGARFILYAQYLNKLTYDKPARKAIDTISAGMKFSVHGDSSIFGTAVRMSQDFSLRYPLIEVKGNNGSQIYGSDVYSAARYLEMRSNKIASEMFSLLDKETIDTWELNYTQDKKYPTVLPSLFPNFVNGCTGIGVALATSIPQFNLKDVCKSAIVLLENPNCSFEEIYCPIDFATGAIIINEDEVKESLKEGKGKSAIIRAKVEFDNKNREIVITEIPYQTTSSNIVAQVQKCIEENKILGIDSVFDGSDINGIKIYIKLLKNAPVENILKLLYKETSLQSYFNINMMMLENGKRPKIYSFKNILSSYLQHLQLVLKKSYIFDLKKAKNRLEILDGLLIAFENLDEIIGLIKKAESKEKAILLLKENFDLSDLQSRAILELKLQTLVHLEKIKIEKEHKEIEEKVKYLDFVLSSKEEFQKNIKDIINKISKDYGDEHKTKNISLTIQNETEIIEDKNLIVYLTNFNNLYIEETSTLLTQGKGGKGAKIKLQKNEYVIKTITGKNNSNILIFTDIGRAYSISLHDLLLNNNIYSLINLEQKEKIIQICLKDISTYIIFITKNGLIKKSKLSEYNITKKGVNALKLLNGDSIVKVLFINEEKIALLTKKGRFKLIDSVEINPIGRISQGVIGIKLEEFDFLVDAQSYSEEEKSLEVISITEEGLTLRTSLNEFSITGRPTKGKTLQKGELVSFIILNPLEKEIGIVSSQNIIKIPLNNIPLYNRGAQGVKVIDLGKNEIIGLVKNL